MKSAKRGIVWGALLILFFSTGCTKKLVDGTEDAGLPDGSAQGTMSMPSGEGGGPGADDHNTFRRQKRLLRFRQAQSERRRSTGSHRDRSLSERKCRRESGHRRTLRRAGNE